MLQELLSSISEFAMNGTSPETRLANQLIPESNKNGFETFFVISPAVVYSFLAVYLETRFNLKKNLCFVLEIFIIIVPEILGMTLLSNYSHAIWYALFACMLLLICLNRRIFQATDETVFDTKFITNTRSTINILSVIAILAVDFGVFPSRFHKTHMVGYSVMDAGVGMYVFANGIVSPESRELKNPVLKSVKGSLALLIVGIGRLIMTRLFHYHVPVGEYGVHWNFFITLAVTKVFTSFFLNIVNVKYIYINAIVLLCAHEMLLESGLKQFVFDEFPRDNFIKANKEGIVSSLGFVILYLFSVYFGYILQMKKRKQSTVAVVKKHLIGGCAALLCSVIFEHFFGISRRVANAAYICWILFLGISSQVFYFLIETAQKAIFNGDSPALQVPYINDAVNFNGLAFFLVGNLLTGFVNLTIDTRAYETLDSLLIVLTYMIVNLLVVGFLYARGVRLKF
ncbi:unnamed protein product [Phyllotreta striolata]|uniref:Phosphatidylinositol-glycan biosynthesis class W protein n=1 Tax=Phyllotreta striolata TaxID=444603 RepID=A0A9N9TZN9_PHYSR|nr:unnamed protein product [Phyllotreta striolata]